MKNKNARRAKLFATIGSIMCIVMTVLMLSFSMFTPITVTINGSSMHGTLPELTAYPAYFTTLLSMLTGLFVLGLIAFFLGRSVSKNATTVKGLILIVMGFPAIAAFGGGIFLMIAGVQTLLAKKVQELTALS